MRAASRAEPPARAPGPMQCAHARRAWQRLEGLAACENDVDEYQLEEVSLPNPPSGSIRTHVPPAPPYKSDAHLFPDPCKENARLSFARAVHGVRCTAPAPGLSGGMGSVARVGRWR